MITAPFFGSCSEQKPWRHVDSSFPYSPHRTCKKLVLSAECIQEAIASPTTGLNRCRSFLGSLQWSPQWSPCFCLIPFHLFSTEKPGRLFKNGARCVPSLLKSTASAGADKERVEAEILQPAWAPCGLRPLLSCPALPRSPRPPRSFWNKPKCSCLLGCDPFPEGSSHLFQVLAYFLFWGGRGGGQS